MTTTTDFLDGTIPLPRTSRDEVWRLLAEDVDPASIQWRQDGRPIQRDGRFIARFVAFIDATTVRERLDAVVPGEWDLTLELLPTLTVADGDGVANDTPVSFKARLQVLGVIREDVGCGKDYKQASTDAFKRAAVRFGIGHELYAYEQNWVELDGDGKFARPVEDPAAAYARKLARAEEGEPRPRPAANRTAAPAAPATAPAKAGEDMAALLPTIPDCPKCAGKMWDNRLSKRNPKAPDYKCRDRSCDGVIWPAKKDEPKAVALVDEIPF